MLPPLSSALLPAPYRSLMTNPAAPVYEFFTEEIKLDMEGKSYDWEAVVLLRNRAVGGKPLLPVVGAALKSVAVVGPSADRASAYIGAVRYGTPNRRSSFLLSSTISSLTVSASRLCLRARSRSFGSAATCSAPPSASTSFARRAAWS